MTMVRDNINDSGNKYTERNSTLPQGSTSSIAHYRAGQPLLPQRQDDLHPTRRCFTPNDKMLYTIEFTKKSGLMNGNMTPLTREDNRYKRGKIKTLLILANYPIETPTFYLRRWHPTNTLDQDLCTDYMNI
ncbi:hypothetical protein DPMN_060613 [Dreissena polymorpha]|uniref:Uncharacterized protein n=1 Tax=Dreissena polymorpha TaxID=45954 RepID=A0A9D4C615_DREPO|nr:hypothetical protein DPMN_060613 [Dreissena polymorpha]